MKSSLTILLLFVSFFSSFTVFGFGGGKGYVSGNFWAADLNRNERLDKSEAKHVYNLADNDIYERYDQNNDGYINFAEFSEFMQQSPWTKPFN